MKLYESRREALAYLQEGNLYEREKAVQTLSVKFSTKKDYDLFLEIFLSDIDFGVRKAAFSAMCHCREDKLWEILEFLFEEDKRRHYMMLEVYVTILARCLLNEHGKEDKKQRFYK